jgi:hypothetical protein
VEATRVAAGAALVVGGLTVGDWRVVPALVAGLMIGVGPMYRLTPRGTLRGAPGLPAVIASRGLITFAFFATDAFVPFALTSGRGASTFAGSIAVTVATVCWTGATWIQDRWIGRLGERRFIRAGFLLLFVGIVIVGAAARPDLLPFWTIHVGAGFAGSGMGLAYSAHAQAALRAVDEGSVGSTTSSLQLTDNLGIALGTGVVGAVVAFGDGLGWAPGNAVAGALLVPALVAGLGIALSRRLPRFT